MPVLPTSTIVLVHGAGESREVWDGWAGRYRSRGYHVAAPACSGGPAQAVADELDGLLRELGPPPIVMGRPGVAEVLVAGGRCVAGVALVPRGVHGWLARLTRPRTPGLLHLRGEPREPGWEALADRALSWGVEAADARR